MEFCNSVHSSDSPDVTHQIAHAFGSSLRPGDLCLFLGDLGAGKTTFIRGIVEGAIGIDPREVSSPTFTYLNIYQKDKNLSIYHFDLYRLKQESEFIEAGFDEFLSMKGICCIEWAEKIPSLLPLPHYEIQLNYQKENSRLITIRTVT